ncbi:hypothetical protein [Streptomyces sp. NPDC056061]|uniref:hypothetical protein n=1 Tax=Streptomyces sp. NPDC056061 TaxID=3345700 RepID=UPI0035D5EDDC
MTKRAKDICYGDKIMTESGVADVQTVDPDTESGTVLIGCGDALPTIYGITEAVEVL